MSDIGERTAVHERRVAFERLDEIGQDRILEQYAHGAIGFEIASPHRFFVARAANDDIAQALRQIFQALGEAENRHHFRRHGDVESVFAWETVSRAAQRRDDFTQRAIVHIHDSPPRNAPRVEFEFVAPVNVVVDQGGEQIVRRGDGVEIAGEVQVDIFHRRNLGPTAARRSAFHAKAGSETGFAQTDDSAFANPIQSITQADRSGGLTLARGRRCHRRHQNQLAIRPIGQLPHELQGELRFVRAVLQKLVARNIQARRDFFDRLQLDLTLDLDIALMHASSPNRGPPTGPHNCSYRNRRGDCSGQLNWSKGLAIATKLSCTVARQSPVSPHRPQ